MQIGRLIGFTLAFVVFMAACAYTPRTPLRGDARVITGDELSSVNVGNLYHAIEQLRPLWLYKRTPKSLAIPTTIAVVQEGSYFGGVETLRGMSPLGVSRIEFLDGPAAAASVISLTNGQHVEAAIILEFSR